jgi:gluconokinase
MPRHVVVMGVSGCGKTTVAESLSRRVGLVFADADEFHSPENVARMRAGMPLEDADRRPWLDRLAAWLASQDAAGLSTVLACSALRRAYRDILRAGAPGLVLVHLDGSAAMIRGRVDRRSGHYMPASLLDSQLATLEPLEPDETGIVLDASLPPDDLVTTIIVRLNLPVVTTSPADVG